MKHLDAWCVFFHLNFLNAQGILAQRIYDACTIFRQFSDVKSGGQSQQPSILGQLVSGKPQHCSKRVANLIFQWVSLSNVTLLSIVFFACGVHKLN